MPVQSFACATMQKACMHHFPPRQLHLHQRSLSASSVRTRPPKLSLQVSATSTANLSHDVVGSQQVIEVEEPFQPLTKVRKKQKPSATAAAAAAAAAAARKLDLDWQKAGKVTRYGAVAVAAGFALKALAVDVNSVAAIGATLTAGGAMLQAIRAGGDKRARRYSTGGSEPFFAAIALSLTAANKLTKAINSYMQPRKASGYGTTQAVTRTPTGGTDEESDEDLRERLQALWKEEIADAYFDPNYMTDAQWTICGKLIALSPSPVPTDDAQQFALEFESSQRLPGQLLESQDGQVLSLDEQQASLSDNVQPW